jgi:hypothetical protein
MRHTATLALLATLLSAPTSARAESDTHYQDNLLGARAAGMGGASIALGGEATASFYNPAGIVVDKATLIQVSMSAYRWRNKKTTVFDVCGKTLDEDEGGLFGFPASVGFVKLFGDKIRHAIGLTLLVPYTSKRSQAFVVDDADCNQRVLDLGGSSWLTDRVFIGALSYAVRPWRWLQLGVSVGLVARDISVSGLSTLALRVEGVSDTVTNFSYSEADVTMWSAYLQLGAIAEPLPGLRVGLTLTTPYLRIEGTGRFDTLEAFRDPTDPASGPGTAELQTLDDVEFYWKVPLKLGFGVAYSRPGVFTVAADVKLNLPTGLYQAVQHPRIPAQPGLTIERQLVVNANLGAEVWVWPKKLALRAGFFTNFASQPEPSDPTRADEQEESIDLFGGSLGGAYRTNKASLVTFAVQVMYGTGKSARLRIARPTSPQQPLNPLYDFGETKDLSVTISIGGAVDLD